MADRGGVEARGPTEFEDFVLESNYRQFSKGPLHEFHDSTDALSSGESAA